MKTHGILPGTLLVFGVAASAQGQPSPRGYLLIEVTLDGWS
jgi:hypothetical protein